MCLLVFSWLTVPGYPLVVAANRDERLDRPAEAICTLRADHPRILGGRDAQAGGTWLAVNEHGVVAGLTNQPSPGGRDPSKRSRGELPLLATSGRTTAEGIGAVLDRVRPGAYNPAHLLVGDRRSLTSVEIPLDGRPTLRALEPGVHVLENVGLGEPSAKVDHVLALLGRATAAGIPVWDALPGLLADHQVPDDAPGAEVTRARGATAGGPAGAGEPARPVPTWAACVHTEEYGTRSAALVRVAEGSDRPELRVADGPPCRSVFVDQTGRWSLPVG